MLRNPCALGGGALAGENWVKFAYLDEAGISNPDHEPIMVVAGVVIDADGNWMDASKRLSALADEVVPPEQRGSFFFHAKDIYNGKGAFPREKYTLDSRLEIMRRILAIMNDLTIPIIYGAARRKDLEGLYKLLYGLDRHQCMKVIHALCYFNCVAWLEHLMRTAGEENEIASIVIENNAEVRQIIKSIHTSMGSPKAITMHVPDQMRHLFPVTKIVDTTHFAEKSEAPMLQLADMAAFCMKRCIAKSPHWEAIAQMLPRSKTIHRPEGGSLAIGGIL